MAVDAGQAGSRPALPLSPSVAMSRSVADDFQYDPRSALRRSSDVSCSPASGVADRRSSTVVRQLSAADRQPSTVSYQSSTVVHRPSSVNRQPPSAVHRTPVASQSLSVDRPLDTSRLAEGSRLAASGSRTLQVDGSLQPSMSMQSDPRSASGFASSQTLVLGDGAVGGQSSAINNNKKEPLLLLLSISMIQVWVLWLLSTFMIQVWILWLCMLAVVSGHGVLQSVVHDAWLEGCVLS